jgi:hypothetical protein
MAIDIDDIHEVEVSPLEYVIYLGAQGNHILFDNDRIRETFSKHEHELADLGTELVGQIRDALRMVFQIPEFEDKRDFISSLPRDVQHVLIFLYFQMVEKTVHLNQRLYH